MADRILENCDLAEHKIGKGTCARETERLICRLDFSMRTGIYIYFNRGAK